MKGIKCFDKFNAEKERVLENYMNVTKALISR